MDKKNGEAMSGIEDKSRTSISNAASVAEIGEDWDSHSLADYWSETREVDLEVRADMNATTQARQPEATAETLLNDDERERTIRALDAFLECDQAEQREALSILKGS